jgi:hypothetical protein
MQDLMTCDPFPAPHSVYGLETLDPWSNVAPEQRAFAALPPMLQEILLDEAAENEDFLGYYIIPTLRTRNPYQTFIGDFGRAMAEDGVYVGQLGDLGSLKKRLKKAVKKVSKVIHAPAMKAIRSVAKGTKKVWRKYGNIIIGIAGAALALFTGGAALAAAAALSAANTAYMTKRAASAAKKAASADAASLAAQSAQQEAELLVQVDKFYDENRAWFEQYGITPDKWAQLTLDQKIDIINAGAKGTLPVGIGPVVDPNTGQPVSTPPSGGPPPGGVQPPPSGGGVTWGGGGGGGGEDAQYGPPPSAPGGAPVDQDTTVGTFDLLVEGQRVGTFTKLEDAAKAALGMTVPGDRFEVIANGKSTGLRIRTSSGSVDVPPGMEEQVRAMPRDKMGEFVAQAEKDVKKDSGGLPWGWILLAAGGAAKITGII